jgi:soluble lytic murein transglycosylase-like protein
MSAMVLGAPSKPKAAADHADIVPRAEVRVSMDSFAALPPYLAYDDIIDEAARTHGVDADLIHAIIQAESSFNPQAVSAAGAQGLMQLMPIVQAELGVTNPFDPRENIMAGTAYLKQLLSRHKGNVALALASFNAGPGNVTKYRGMPPFRETRRYVKKITRMLNDGAD